MLLGSFSYARVDAQTSITSNDKVTVQMANNTTNGGKDVLYVNIDGVSYGPFNFVGQGTGNITVTAKEGYSISSMMVTGGSSSYSFTNGSPISIGMNNTRTLNITTAPVAPVSYTMYFTAGDHVTLTVPSGAGYQEVVANKQYSLTLATTATLPALPTATAETGYETPTWSPNLPTSLTSAVNNQTYTATAVAKTVYTLTYDYGTASMSAGDDGLTPALPASQNAYAGGSLVVADNVNLIGNATGTAVFLYWSTTRNNTGPSAKVYHPDDLITMTANITLYPIFGVVEPTTFTGNFYVHTVTGVPSDHPELEPRTSTDYKFVGTGTISLPTFNITGNNGYKAYYTGSDLTSSGYLLTIPSYTTADLNTMFGTTFPAGTSIVWYVIKDQPWEGDAARYHIDGYIVLPIVYHDVTFSIDAGTGTLSGTTSYSVEENTLLSTTVTAIPTVTPAAGYAFQNWQLVGTATTFANAAAVSTYLSTHNSTTNLEFKAVLTPIAYTLNINYVFSDGNKPVTGYANVVNQAINVNSDLTITSPAAPAGYTVDKTSVVVSHPTANIATTVTYSPVAYTLNINYVFSDGNKPLTGYANVVNQAINIGSSFTITSPAAPAGYTVDKTSVVVSHPTANIATTVTYSPIAYTLNINYVFSDGNKPATGYENVVNQAINVNSSFTVTSPAAPAGYTVNTASVSVSHPTANITKTVTYTPITYKLTFKAENHVTLTVPSGAGYIQVTAGKEYYLNYNVNTVLPTLPTATADSGYNTPTWSPALPTALTIGISGTTYKARTELAEHTLNITYVFSDGNKPATGYANVVNRAINVNSSFTVTSPAAPAGYTVDKTSVVVSHPTADIATTVTYTPIAYKLNISYVFSDGNKPATGFENVVNQAINVNSSFIVTSPTAPAGYSVDKASVAVSHPTSNISTTVTYSPIAYTLNINYVFSDGNKPATGFENVVDQAINVNSDFTITSPTAPAGYEVDKTSVVVLNPTANIATTVT